MTYKLFLYKEDDKYIGLFPELDDIRAEGDTKEEARTKAIVYARNYLKKQTTPPKPMLVDEIRGLLALD